jgi:hypothetical protein
MSDIQDLIHTTTLKAYEAGIRHEQERINKLLDQYIAENPERIQETLRRRLAFVRGLVNDQDAWKIGKAKP